MICDYSLFEIKGAPCTLCPHFGCRLHRFQHMCTQYVHGFSNKSIPSFKGQHMDKMPGAPFWLPMHPECAQYKTLISCLSQILRKNGNFRGKYRNIFYFYNQGIYNLSKPNSLCFPCVLAKFPNSLCFP